MSIDATPKAKPNREAFDLKERCRLVSILPVSKVEPLTVNDIVNRIDANLKAQNYDGVDWQFDENTRLRANFSSEVITIFDITSGKAERTEIALKVQELFPHELQEM